MRSESGPADRLHSAIEESRALRRQAGELIAVARKQLQSHPDIDAVMRESFVMRAKASLNVATARRLSDPRAN